MKTKFKFQDQEISEDELQRIIDAANPDCREAAMIVAFARFAIERINSNEAILGLLKEMNVELLRQLERTFDREVEP